MNVSIPSSGSLSELQATIEFVKFISTAEGLQSALQQITAARAELNEQSVKAQNDKAELAAEAAKVEKAKADAHKVIEEADALTANIKSREEAQNERDRVFDQNESISKAKLDKRAGELDAREAAIKVKENQVEEILNNSVKELNDATDLKKEYEEKLAKLKTAIS